MNYSFLLPRTLPLLLGACAAVALLAPANLSAQERFVETPLPFTTSFDNSTLWPRPGAEFFWLDEDRGFYYTFDELAVSDGLIYYSTRDGGETWSRLDNAVPIPHRRVNGSMLLSAEAEYSTDDGDSWMRLSGDYSDTNYFPDQDLRWSMTRSVAFDTAHLAVLYQLYDVDDGSTDSVAFGPFRLAFSSDAGSTWRYVDSIKVFGSVLQELDSLTDFGPFPVPDGMTNVISNGWWQLVGMPNDSTLLVATKAFGTVDGDRTNLFYLGRLDLNALTATWTLLPFSEPIFPPPATDLRLEMLSESVIWALQGSFVDIFNDPELISWKIWRSDDGGRSWDTIDAPDWVDYRSLRFVDEVNGVAENAYTYDGGRTWNRRIHPFESGGLFYAVDSSTYRLVDRYSFFARSTDAGATWDRNDAGGLPLDVSAESGHVLAGRTYAGLLISRDSGETWRDFGLEDRLPARTHRVWTAAWPDRDFDSNRIVAIATLREIDGSDKLVVLETTDGGEVWSIGEELTEFDPVAGGLDLNFTFDPEGEIRAPVGFLSGPDGLYTTENDGVTWTFTNGDLAIEALSMINTQQGTAVTSDGLFRTNDGGKTFTLTDARASVQQIFVGIDQAEPDLVAALFSTVGSTAWSAEVSRDFGETFGEVAGPGAPRAMDAGFFWGDTNDAHTLSRFGIVQHSSDAATSFNLEVDSTEIFRASVGYVEAEADRDYIYIVGPANRAARFYMYWERPLSAPWEPLRLDDIEIRISSNPVIDREAFVTVAGESIGVGQLRIVDTDGRIARVVEGVRIGETLRLDLEGIASGAYLILFEGEDSRGLARIVLTR